MGDPKKSHKKYRRPRKLFEKERIESENQISNKFGLKNKREIWKADSEIGKIRRQAKELVGRSGNQKKIDEFIGRLKQKGFNISTLDDVLSLTLEDWLNRRLQTIVFRKKLSHTPKEARQLIVHKNITVDGKIVDAPSFHVSVDLENKVKRIKKIKKEKKAEIELPKEIPIAAQT